jgi:alpha-glucosidase (family GH31 glycosyl hydrolase)
MCLTSLTPQVLAEGATSVKGYFPAAAMWYDIYTGMRVGTGWQTVASPLTHIPLHLRGGEVYVTQHPALNTVQSRQNPLEVIAALDASGEASGSLFWDDGESLDTYSAGLYTEMAYTVSGGHFKVREREREREGTCIS